MKPDITRTFPGRGRLRGRRRHRRRRGSDWRRDRDDAGRDWRLHVRRADGPAPTTARSSSSSTGFPRRPTEWRRQLHALGEAGFRAVAPDQRGYSAGARPPRVEDYALPLLVGDVIGLADALGAERFHVVGHDWGAVVAWGLAVAARERVITANPVSVPPPRRVRSSPERSGLVSGRRVVLFRPVRAARLGRRLPRQRPRAVAQRLRGHRVRGGRRVHPRAGVEGSPRRRPELVPLAEHRRPEPAGSGRRPRRGADDVQPGATATPRCASTARC